MGIYNMGSTLNTVKYNIIHTHTLYNCISVWLFIYSVTTKKEHLVKEENQITAPLSSVYSI